MNLEWIRYFFYFKNEEKIARRMDCVYVVLSGFCAVFLRHSAFVFCFFVLFCFAPSLFFSSLRCILPLSSMQRHFRCVYNFWTFVRCTSLFNAKFKCTCVHHIRSVVALWSFVVCVFICDSAWVCRVHFVYIFCCLFFFHAAVTFAFIKYL